MEAMKRAHALLWAVVLGGWGINGAVARTTDTDGDWQLQTVELKDTREAEVVIRLGDIDNLGFGFVEGFNPFTGRSTDVHPFPFDPAKDDAAATDRIMVGSSYNGENIPAGQDGYSFDFNPDTRPLKAESLKIPLKALSGVTVRDAVLCLFVDDFQSPTFKSQFEVTVNGKRFPEMERTLNALNQTGPIGKVIYVKLSQEMLENLKGESLEIRVDDPHTRAGDGFAFDFAKLMVNVKDFLYRGNVPGRVVDDETGDPIASATVEVAGFAKTQSDREGQFQLAKVPAGLAVVQAGAPGYSSAQVSVDVVGDESSEPVELRLRRSAAVEFTGKQVREGDKITLNKIQFDVNSTQLRAEGMAELDRVAAFLKDNPGAEIELSGHTSSEGGAALNRDLSFRRVFSCKGYLTQAGIGESRITTIGHGPDFPVAPNDTESNRALNRRVEMKITKL